MSFNLSRIALAALVVLATEGSPGYSQNKPAPADKICKNEAGVAVGGYDVVSYFTSKKPEQGSASISLLRDGAEYRFVSTSHRDQFAAHPESYLPQYGGHCAWALSKGKAMTGDPKAWLIYKGKLYLTVSREMLSQFQTDAASVIQQADEIWKQLY